MRCRTRTNFVKQLLVRNIYMYACLPHWSHSSQYLYKGIRFQVLTGLNWKRHTIEEDVVLLVCVCLCVMNLIGEGALHLHGRNK